MRPSRERGEHGAESASSYSGPNGEPDDVWWLGFDCSHPGDLSPMFVRQWRKLRWPYRDLAYVRAEVESLATQAVAAQEQPAQQTHP